MQWLGTAGLQLSLGIPEGRPDIRGRPAIVIGKSHFPSRLGVSELKGGVGRGEPGQLGMFLVSLHYFRVSVYFSLSNG